MLGDLFYTLKGQESNVRVLEVKNGLPQIESTLTGIGTLKDGTIVTEVGTSKITIMPDGSMHGDHVGMIKTNDGKEVATNTVKGIEHSIDDGRKTSFRGAVFITTSSGGKLAFMITW